MAGDFLHFGIGAPGDAQLGGAGGADGVPDFERGDFCGGEAELCGDAVGAELGEDEKEIVEGAAAAHQAGDDDVAVAGATGDMEMLEALCLRTAAHSASERGGHGAEHLGAAGPAEAGTLRPDGPVHEGVPIEPHKGEEEAARPALLMLVLKLGPAAGGCSGGSAVGRGSGVFLQAVADDFGDVFHALHLLIEQEKIEPGGARDGTHDDEAGTGESGKKMPGACMLQRGCVVGLQKVLCHLALFFRMNTQEINLLEGIRNGHSGRSCPIFLLHSLLGNAFLRSIQINYGFNYDMPLSLPIILMSEREIEVRCENAKPEDMERLLTEAIAYWSDLDNTLLPDLLQIQELHRTMFDGYLRDGVAGRLKTVANYVKSEKGYVHFTSPAHVQEDYERLFDQAQMLMNRLDPQPVADPDPRNPAHWPAEDDQQAWRDRAHYVAYFHAHFIHIHPFKDGNGRVSRLVAWEQARRLFPAVCRAGYDWKVVNAKENPLFQFREEDGYAHGAYKYAMTHFDYKKINYRRLMRYFMFQPGVEVSGEHPLPDFTPTHHEGQVLKDGSPGAPRPPEIDPPCKGG